MWEIEVASKTAYQVVNPKRLLQNSAIMTSAMAPKSKSPVGFIS